MTGTDVDNSLLSTSRTCLELIAIDSGTEARRRRQDKDTASFNIDFYTFLVTGKPGKGSIRTEAPRHTICTQRLCKSSVRISFQEGCR